MNLQKRIKNNKRVSFGVCTIEGCNEFFEGDSRYKYCKEHRKDKYKKIKYSEKYSKKLKKNDILINNQIIKHNYLNSIKDIYKCDCCDESFEILIIPNTYIYPRFCPKHRTEHRRKIYKLIKIKT